MVDYKRISPYNINTVSSRQVNESKEKININKIRRLLVDLMPNSPNYRHKNCISDSKENY